MLTDDVHKLIEDSVLCWLATASSDGQPSVSPKEIFAAQGNAIIIANIASPGSARNVRHNPRASVSFIDIFVQRGYQIAGEAVLLTPRDDAYAEAETALLAMTGNDYPFRTIFRIAADSVTPIVAPRYKLFPETTEAQQIANAMRTYGVRPAS
ncbi:MAG: pyridoxamine 5'-phosphate oxidase family protein [Planctomycetota bacterium]